MNDAKAQIKEELSNLLGQQKEIVRLLEDLKDAVGFGTTYQRWYTKSLKVVRALAPDKYDEFVSYYLPDSKRKFFDGGNYAIQDYIKGLGPGPNRFGEMPFESAKVATLRFLNQLQILASLSSRIDSILADVEGHLFAELQDKELEAANELKRVNLRAAGALAGVVLERHLQRVAVNHEVKITKRDPTIGDLNDPLKQANVYDVPT
jgi:hypothetical protein